MNNIHNIDLNLISTFCLLFESRSVTRTAEQIGVTQSAISHSLNKLREQLDDPLFVKLAGEMRPTLRAEQLFDTIQEPMNQLQYAIRPEMVFDPNKTQRCFVLAVSDYIEALLLPDLTQCILEEAPNATIRCVRINDFELSETALQADFIFGQFRTPPENLHIKRLWKEKFVTLVAKNHPRITSNRISLRQFLAEQHVLTSPTGVGGSVIDKVLAEQGLSREVKIYPRYFTTPARLVANSELITTVPSKIAAIAAKELPIKSLKTPINIASFEISMLWGPIVHFDPAHRWLRQKIAQLVSAK